MSKARPNIDPELAEWIGHQKIFFVATAPLSSNGHVNCSPKGSDSFRILDPLTVAYQDLTGSGAETIAHLRENGRIVIMFCAVEGPPQIVRLHGKGIVTTPQDNTFADLVKLFPEKSGTRSIIKIRVSRVSSSCGFAVPFYDFRKHRDTLDKYADAKGPEKLVEYRRLKNAQSIDGLPSLDPG